MQRYPNNIYLWKGDITTLPVDAIVAAGNKNLSGCRTPGHCIDAAIFLKAGEGLFEECKKLGGCRTSEAKITDAYKLPCAKIIHTVGPIYSPKNIKKQIEELRWCYINILNLAAYHNIKSIGLCCISTGIYGFPNKLACEIAVDTVNRWVKSTIYKFDKIIFDVWTDKDYELYSKQLNKFSSHKQ